MSIPVSRQTFGCKTQFLTLKNVTGAYLYPENGHEKRTKAASPEFYFQANLTKTEIAERLGVNRRTIMLWCQEGNWARLKRSARHMPSLVAEKCYYLLDQYTSKFLDGYNFSNFSEKHAEAISRLATSIKKLKNRSTTNESMEMFNFFMESVKHKDPALAAQILPHVEDYISARKDFNVSDHLLEEFDADGVLLDNTKEIDDRWQDEKDVEAFKQELQNTNNDYDLALQNWQTEPPTPDPTGEQNFNPPGEQIPAAARNEAASRNEL